MYWCNIFQNLILTQSLREMEVTAKKCSLGCVNTISWFPLAPLTLLVFACHSSTLQFQFQSGQVWDRLLLLRRLLLHLCEGRSSRIVEKLGQPGRKVRRVDVATDGDFNGRVRGVVVRVRCICWRSGDMGQDLLRDLSKYFFPYLQVLINKFYA